MWYENGLLPYFLWCYVLKIGSRDWCDASVRLCWCYVFKVGLACLRPKVTRSLFLFLSLLINQSVLAGVTVRLVLDVFQWGNFKATVSDGCKSRKTLMHSKCSNCLSWVTPPLCTILFVIWLWKSFCFFFYCLLLLKEMQYLMPVRDINTNIPDLKCSVLKVKGCCDVVCKWITLITLTLLLDYKAILEQGE